MGSIRHELKHMVDGENDAHGCVIACAQEFVRLYGPAVLLFDDAHHFDTASWRLLAAVAGGSAGALLIAVAMRPQKPVTDAAAAAAPESVAACVRQCKQALLSSPGAKAVSLESFTRTETEQYMAQALADVALPSEQVHNLFAGQATTLHNTERCCVALQSPALRWCEAKYHVRC